MMPATQMPMMQPGMMPMMGAGMPMSSAMPMSPGGATMGGMPMMMGMPMMGMPGMMPMMGAGMPGMMPMMSMMCRMRCEMDKDGMVCRMTPMDSGQMEAMKLCCEALRSMMAMGAPCVMMCNGMPLLWCMPMEK